MSRLRALDLLRSKRPALLVLMLVIGVVVLGSTASAFAAGPSLPATISVRPDGFEIDNTMAQARTFQVGGAIQQRTIHSPSDTDWIKFSVKAGSTYDVDSPDVALIGPAEYTAWKDLPGALVFFEVYDANGKMIAFSQSRGLGYYYDSRRTTARRSAMGRKTASLGPNSALEQVKWKSTYSGVAYVRVVPATSDWQYYSGMGRYELRVRSVVANITGRVIDSHGNPIRNVGVNAYPYAFGELSMPSPATSSFTFTDANGYYILSDLNPAQNYRVDFDPTYWYYGWLQYAPESYKNWHDGDAGDPTSVTVTGMLTTPHIDAQLEDLLPNIQGRVVDSDGNGVANAAVYAYTSMYSWSTSVYTDANGYYGFYKLPGWTASKWQVFANDSSSGLQRFAQTYWNGGAFSDPMGTAPSYVVPGSFDITVSPYPQVAHGRVVNDSGAPLADIQVAVCRANGNVIGYTYTDATGNWEYRTTESTPVATTYLFTDMNGIYQSEWFDNVSAFASATVVQAGDPDASVNATLTIRPADVQGTVTDQTTGKPIKGIQVWAWGYFEGGWAPIDVVTTGADGRYLFQNLHWNPFTVEFVDPSGAYMSEYYDNAPSAQFATLLTEHAEGNVANAALLTQGGRLYGEDRYSAAAAIAKSNFPNWNGVTDVVIASGADAAQADALSAGSLCWAYDAPMLLAQPTGLSGPTWKALKDIKAAAGAGTVRVHVVGGPASVGSAALAQAEAIVGTGNVERIYGPDRYGTARAVALASHFVAVSNSEDPGFAIVANGADPSKFFDALSAAAISAKTGAPILLTRTASVPNPTASALSGLGSPDVYVVGGTSSVAGNVYSALHASGRIAGPDRYSTSVAVARAGIAHGWLTVYKIGVAATSADALTGGANIGGLGGPLLVTAKTYLPSSTFGFIKQYNQMIKQTVIYGGPGSVGGGVSAGITQALKQ